MGVLFWQFLSWFTQRLHVCVRQVKIPQESKRLCDLPPCREN